MIQIEKIRPTNGINTDISPGAIDNQGNRVLVNPITDALNCRYLVSDEKGLEVRSVLGNKLISNGSLPAGTNKCIGSHEDRQNNRLIFFIYNSNNNHCIFAFDGTSISSIATNLSILGFQDDPKYLITGVGIHNNLLYWCDGLNRQFMINTTRSYAGVTDERVIRMHKYSPKDAPIISVSTPTPHFHASLRKTQAGGPQTNRIADKNLQFAYRYVFLDDEKSVLSPISGCAFAEKQPDLVISGTTRNAIQVVVTTPSFIVPFLKYVELLFRGSNEDTWKSWRKEDPATGIDVFFTHDSNFTELPEDEQQKLFDTTPNTSKALCIHKNRVLCSVDEEGFDVDDPFPIALNVTKHAYDVDDTGNNNHLKSYFKWGGSYNLAIALFDDDGKSMGTFGDVEVNFSPPAGKNTAVEPFDVYHDGASRRAYLTMTLSGNLVSGTKAKYFSIVCTENKSTEQYMQVLLRTVFYKYDLIPGYNVDPNVEFEYNGRIFTRQLPSSNTDYSRLYLQLPLETPFIPDNTYMIRTLNFGSNVVDKILAVVDSEFLVVNNFGITNWSNKQFIMAEIFKPKSDITGIYFELTRRIAINNGVPSVTSFEFRGGDVYPIDQVNTFKALDDVAALFFDVDNDIRIESPSPTFGLKTFVDDTTVAAQKITVDVNIIGIPRITRVVVPKISKADNVKILDYSKIDWHRGFPFAELEDPKKLVRNNVVKFSNRNATDEGLSINGMSSFDPADEYPLPSERSPIKKLVPVRANVLVVHERSMTTLYVEEKFILNPDGSEQLVTTDKFIGDDRPIQVRYGSAHPESVTEYLGAAFGFDVYEGVVWRYTNEGLVPVSNYGKEQFFRELARNILPVKDSTKILGGIDVKNNEYLITILRQTKFLLGTSAAANGWQSVAYGNGLFVAVSNTGVGNRVMTSPNGKDWTIRTSPADNNWTTVTFGNGLFVAVSASGTGNRVMTSPDGITWTLRTSAADLIWGGLTYANGLFVATASSGSGQRVMTSPDGIIWTLRTTPADNNWLAVTFSNNLFVAVATTGAGNRVMTSPDGLNWTIRVSAEDNNWQGVTYGNGLFVAVANSGTNRVMTSPDGISWTARACPAETWFDVVFGNGKFIAVGLNKVMSSFDGIKWELGVSAANETWVAITHGSDRFVAVSVNGGASYMEDAYDSQTWGFNFLRNQWTSKYSFIPEFYGKINDRLVSFRDGNLYLHEDQSVNHNNFYGVQYERKLKIAVNPFPTKSKNATALQISQALLTANGQDFQVVKCYTPGGQETYMRADEFEKLEGVWYGPVLKNILTPEEILETGQIALRHGDDLVDKFIFVELLTDRVDSSPLQFLNLAYVVSEYTE